MKKSVLNYPVLKKVFLIPNLRAVMLLVPSAEKCA